jgi:hypothetical protein
MPACDGKGRIGVFEIRCPGQSPSVAIMVTAVMVTAVVVTESTAIEVAPAIIVASIEIMAAVVVAPGVVASTEVIVSVVEVIRPHIPGWKDGTGVDGSKLVVHGDHT